jgi:hypothetical protein
VPFGLCECEPDRLAGFPIYVITGSNLPCP